MRRRCWACCLFAACLSLAAAAAPTAPRSRVFPLVRRDGVTRARGLLRNASLPLHGAIRDYVSLLSLLHSSSSPPRCGHRALLDQQAAEESPG
jgi:hypothetical protein